MNADRWRKIREVFASACEADSSERAALLNDLCASDESLRREVESLLSASGCAPDLLETPGAGLLGALASQTGDDALAGQSLGPYRIVRLVASGGMGSVYQAERDDQQFRKTVAIKIIRRSLVNELSIRRFLYERQTLANLDHPYIARLLDGGVTPDALPYLVMEYVEGGAIDRFCDEQRLNIAGRLRLFLKVCSAVQYAHQNLIVHRDLKPGNIFVTPEGEPKLLDFGIAKAIEVDDSADEPTMTRTQHRLLTPEYASPEQIRGESITVASDIYSLGVVLYELLSGHRPYRVRSRVVYEIEKAVLEDEPERPSTIVSRVVHMPRTGDDGERVITPESVSATREGEPVRLRRRLRGDLDAIVLTALHKDPRERYTSVEQFAADIRNHLVGLPVMARNSSRTQRLWKHVWRNRYAASALAAAFLLLAAGIAGVAWQRDRALAAGERARQEAENARVEVDKSRHVISFLRDTITAVDPRNSGRDVTMLELLDQAAASVHDEFGADPEVETAIRTAIGETYIGLGRYDDAEPHFRAALKLQEDIHRGDHPDVASSLRNLGVLLYSKRDYEQAEEVCQRALAMSRRLYPDGSPEVAQDLNNLAAVMRARGQFTDAKRLYDQCLEMRRALHGEDSLEVAETLNNMAAIARAENDLDRAVALLQESLRIRRAKLPARHPLVAQSIGNLGVMLATQGKYDQAVPLLKEELDIGREVLGENHPDLAITLANLGAVLMHMEDYDAAEPYLRQSYDIRRANSAGDDRGLTVTETRWGECLVKLGRFEEAEPLLLDAHKQAMTSDGSRVGETREALQSLIELYEAWGRPEDARRYSDELAATSQPASAPIRP